MVLKIIYVNDGRYDFVLPQLLIYFNQKKNKQKEGNARQKGLPRNCELQNTSRRTKKYGKVISSNVLFGVSQCQGGRLDSLWMDST